MYSREWLEFYADEAVAQRREMKEALPADWEDDEDLDDAPFTRQRPFMLETAKTGRNEPCPCGSGKKYKKCCLGKEA